MVDVGVHTVNSNSVYTQHLHEGSVSKAVILVRQRIPSSNLVEARAATRLVGNTNDLVPISCSIVDEVAAFDINGRHSDGQRGGAEDAQDTFYELL